MHHEKDITWAVIKIFFISVRKQNVWHVQSCFALSGALNLPELYWFWLYTVIFIYLFLAASMFMSLLECEANMRRKNVFILPGQSDQIKCCTWLLGTIFSTYRPTDYQKGYNTFLN